MTVSLALDEEQSEAGIRAATSCNSIKPTANYRREKKARVL